MKHNLKSLIQTIISGFVVLSIFFLIPAVAAKKKFLFDKGSKVIDVSKYSPAMRQAYLLFRDKCSLCHTIARPINAPYALPEEWQKIVTKMRQKPDSEIDPAAAVKIYEFLVYDSAQRKQNLITQKLQEKTTAHQAPLEEKTTGQTPPVPAVKKK